MRLSEIVRKDATIENTGSDEDFPGTFRVILSAPTEDRDGETLLPEEWKMPLPDHITFDTDHGMSVATTVGSGTPSIDDKGLLIVEGTYSSLDRAQEARTLVNEGHIRTTSVAFMTTTVPGKGRGAKKVRELLNGAFVAVPSNREALVLESKSHAKAGARNSATDAQRIQQIHDLALELGAAAETKDDDEKTKALKYLSIKAIAGSYEELQERLREVLRDTYNGWLWLRATFPAEGDTPGSVIFDIEDPNTYDSTTWQESFTDDGSTITLGGDRQAVEVEVTETVATAEDNATKTQAAGTASSSAAGASAPAADEEDEPAADEDDDADIQVRAARYRLLIQSQTPERSTT